MLVKQYLSGSYPRVDAYSSVSSAEDELIENNFLVVFEEGNYCGLLVPSDLIRHPKRLVIDCLTEKYKLHPEDTILFALDQLNESHSCALPVFENDRFIGIIEKKNIISALRVLIDELHEKSLISQKAKTEFLNGLSHEIRTPLNGILGFLNILSGMDLNHASKNYKKYTDIISENADRFLLTMNDLIELSLTHSGEGIQLNPEMVNIESVFAELKDFFLTQHQYRNKNLSYTYFSPDSSFDIMVDRKKLKHILYHLIDNASKFSLNNGTISFGMEKTTGDENLMTFFVRNTGSVIPEEDKQTIFNLFEKSKSGTLNTVGLGIGLTVVKNFVESMQGNVELITENNITIFRFSIPLKM